VRPLSPIPTNAGSWRTCRPGRARPSAFIDEAGTETFKAVAVIADETPRGGAERWVGQTPRSVPQSLDLDLCSDLALR
jgi:hypothetical protein